MLVQSSLLGEIEVKEMNIICFEEGIPGFKEEQQFALIIEESSVFLQSVREKDLTFLLVDPFLYFPNYEFDLPKADIEHLNIETKDDVLTYTIVVVKDPLNTSTTNLQAPIVINTKNNKGKQIVLNDSRYSPRHLLFKNPETVEVKG